MSLSFIRILFVLIAAGVGHHAATLIFGLSTIQSIYGMAIGAVLALLIVLFEKLTERVSLRGLSAAIFGLIMALILSNLLSIAIDTTDLGFGIRAAIKLIVVLILAYLGVVFSLRGKDEFNVIIPYVKFQRQVEADTPIILDTSVIIDGRIVDIVKTSFLDGYFVVPKFVLKELQDVADSSDDLKRSRGRRGLDILNKLKKNPKFNFKIHVEDFTETSEVDQKIIRLAKILDGKILTTDYNLNKVADFHGIHVLNINELSNALKPVLLPGEIIEVQPMKEGKEREQAVAYLNDGTMVVVEHGKALIGQLVSVKVTSVFQTPAGRMIFAKSSQAPSE